MYNLEGKVALVTGAGGENGNYTSASVRANVPPLQNLQRTREDTSNGSVRCSDIDHDPPPITRLV